MANLLKRIVMIIVKLIIGLVALVLVLFGIGFVYERNAEASDAESFTAPGQIFAVGDRNMHLYCVGDGQPTVILESGGGSSSVQWWSLQDQLEDVAQVCSYDRQGYGWSDPSPEALTFEEGASDLKALLSAAEVHGPYIMVGHSKGGLHVRTYARLYPDDVAAVLLLDAAEEESIFAEIDFIERSLSESAGQEALARFGAIRFLLRFFPNLVPLPSIPEELVETYHREISRPDTWTAAITGGAAYRLTPSEMRVAGGFGRLGDVPLIVITHGIPYTGGQAFQEEFWPEAMERLVSLSTNSELIVAENSGHAIMWDEPDLVVEAVKSLISKAGY